MTFDETYPQIFVNVFEYIKYYKKYKQIHLSCSVVEITNKNIISLFCYSTHIAERCILNRYPSNVIHKTYFEAKIGLYKVFHATHQQKMHK